MRAFLSLSIPSMRTGRWQAMRRRADTESRRHRRAGGYTALEGQSGSGRDPAGAVQQGHAALMPDAGASLSLPDGQRGSGIQSDFQYVNEHHNQITLSEICRNSEGAGPISAICSKTDAASPSGPTQPPEAGGREKSAGKNGSSNYGNRPECGFWRRQLFYPAVSGTIFHDAAAVSEECR